MTEAGPELDARVAEEVMGRDIHSWRWCCGGDDGLFVCSTDCSGGEGYEWRATIADEVAGLDDDGQPFLDVCPDYSTSIADAMGVLEKTQAEDRFWWKLKSKADRDDPIWQAALVEGCVTISCQRAATLPLAICLAALEADRKCPCSSSE